MKLRSVLFFLLFIHFFSAQKTEMKRFNLQEYNKLIKKSCPLDCEVKTHYNKNMIQFKRNDSIITMSYNENDISYIMKAKGNYYVNYEFHPNLNIKSKTENISGISQTLQTPISIGIFFDQNGNIINRIDYENAPYDENTPGPRKTYQDIILAIKKDFNFDVFQDKSFFGIQSFYDEKIGKVNYRVVVFIEEKNDILKLLNYEYDGDTGKFIKQEKREIQLPEGGLIHY
ncbi:hypothetical protein [Chryseobacterium sp. JK1]|uniref:hypothetical protein n=1 Tax=Chryseobacterium sp. JK1 TaxID=874294 RepID=UPI003D69648D